MVAVGLSATGVKTAAFLLLRFSPVSPAFSLFGALSAFVVATHCLQYVQKC